MTLIATRVGQSFARWSFLLAVLTSASRASAIQLGLGSVGGVMQMPNSSYYLAVYGIYSDVALDSEWLTFRAGYIERPKFQDQGYEDQDFGYFSLIGTKFTKAKDHGLYGYFGFGEQRGYIKPEDMSDRSELSSYQISGPAAALEYAAVFHSITVALTHQTFLGYANGQQFNARVLWPVNFYLVRVGMIL